MKPVDLTKLNYERLQKHRKSLTNKQHAWDWYGIGENVVDELNRVLTECKRRNKILAQEKRKQTWAHVATHKDLNPKCRYKRK